MLICDVLYVAQVCLAVVSQASGATHACFIVKARIWHIVCISLLPVPPRLSRKCTLRPQRYSTLMCPFHCNPFYCTVLFYYAQLRPSYRRFFLMPNTEPISNM